MASIKGVLTGYFKQLHFNDMKPEVSARWEDYLKAGDLTDPMKDWRNQLMHETAPDSGEYENNALPDIFAELQYDYNQIEELYKAINDALGGMKEDNKLKTEAYSKVKAFVDEFYGDEPEKPFHPVKLSDAAETILATVNFEELRPAINSLINDYGLKSEISFDQLVEGIRTKKYNKDVKFKDNFVYILENIGSQRYKYSIVTEPLQTKFLEIAKGFELKPTNVDIAKFKDCYPDLFRRIYKAPKVKEIFSSYDHGVVCGPLDTAREAVDYDKSDSPNFIPPKGEDELTLFQQVKKYVGDTYEDCFAKYIELRGDRMFFSMPAQFIVKGISKEGIKPTEGIEAVLNKADSIKKRLKQISSKTTSNKALDHFDWFVKEMNDIKDKMPEAFAGSLKNGPQLRAIVQKIIRDAIPAKVKEAKTAMEVLSVIKYANTTSAIMDNLKSDKELFKIFSNKDLSWNKNAGAEFVTSALDKSVRAAFIGIGYGATMAINGIRKSRSKIRRENKDLKAAHDDWKQRNEQDRDAMQAKHDRMVQRQHWANVVLGQSRSRTAIEADIQSHNNLITTTKQNLETSCNNLSNQANTLVQNNPNLANDPDVQAIAEYIDQVRDGQTNIQKPQLAGTFAQLQPIVDRIDNDLNLLDSTQGQLGDRQEELQNFLDATGALNNATQQITATQEKLNSWDEDHKDLYDDLIKHWNRLETGRDSHLGEMYDWRPGKPKDKQLAFWEKQGGRGI